VPVCGKTRLKVLWSGEEGGSGKVLLLEKGAYEGLDVCLMCVLSSYFLGGFMAPSSFISDVTRSFEFRCHPAPGRPHGATLTSSLAVVQRQVDYTGHT